MGDHWKDGQNDGKEATTKMNGTADRGFGFSYSTPSTYGDRITHSYEGMTISDEKNANNEESSSIERPVAWKTVCYDFTQNTTFHGVNKITESTPFILRRILWVLIVMGGASLFVYQMISSIVHYMDRPVTVNIKINYNKTVKFPSITICNQNVFRTSEAAKHNYYSLIDHLYSGENMQHVNLGMFNASNYTLVGIYNSTAHNKNDMIVSCLWDRETCTVDNFSMIITDHGPCYTFNNGGESEILNTTQTGSDRGLSLRLNVEQYEYMHGPNSAAGVKILVHDQKEIPLVRELGQAISPGSHAFVGIQMLQIDNLQPPYGECGDEKELEYFEHYTIPACLVECKEKSVVESCGCRLAYMPVSRFKQDYPPVCQLWQHQQCVHSTLDNKEFDETLCDCPVPCQRKMFETSISYATTSKFDTDRDIRGDMASTLMGRFVLARETVQRVDTMLAQQDSAMVSDLRDAGGLVVKSFQIVLERMTNVSHTLKSVMDDIRYRSWFHDKRGLRDVQRALVYGFIQAWDIEQQITLEPLGSGTREFLKSYRKTIEKLSNVSMDEVAFRNMLEWSIEDILTTKSDLATRSLNAITRVHDAFNNGQYILPYRWSISERYDDYYVPKDLLRHREGYQEHLYNLSKTDVGTLQGYLKQLRKNLHDVAAKRGTFDEVWFQNLRIDYIDMMENFNYVHNLFKDAVVHHTKDLMEMRMNDFHRLTDSLEKEMADVRLTVENMLDLVVETMHVTWRNVEQMIQDSENYIHDEELRKTDLANEMFSESLSFSLQQIEDFFTDLRARGRNFDHDWRKFTEAYIAVWVSMIDETTTRLVYEKMLDDFTEYFETNNETLGNILVGIFEQEFEHLDSIDLHELYTRVNADIPTINKTEHISRLEKQLETILQHGNIADMINDDDDRFFDAVKIWQESLGQFLAQSEVKEQFFKENFLEIDVFMKELYYEQIEQQVAYDVTNLFCDIGGSMGLFVGASVITVFELFDAILHNLSKRQFLRPEKKRHTKLYQVKNAQL